MVCQKWIDLTLHWLTFRSISEIFSYERMDDLMSLLTISFEHVHVHWEHTGGHIVRMLEYFLQRCPKDRSKISVQKVYLLHIKFELRDLNYQTPLYAGCIWKYQENSHKIYFLVDSSCIFKAISKRNILKQRYKEEK